MLDTDQSTTAEKGVAMKILFRGVLHAIESFLLFTVSMLITCSLILAACLFGWPLTIIIAIVVGRKVYFLVKRRGKTSACYNWYGRDAPKQAIKSNILGPAPMLSPRLRLIQGFAADSDREPSRQRRGFGQPGTITFRREKQR